MNLQSIELSDITASATNPRRHFDKEKLKELASSIRDKGVLQPVLVRAHPTRVGYYELIAGERRFRASKEAGLTSIPAIVRELGDKEVLEIQVIENLQRDDLHPLEEAEGYERLMGEHGYTAVQVGERIGKTKSYVNKCRKFLSLIPAARKAFLADDFPRGVALALARIPDDALQAKALAQIDDMSPKGACEHIQKHYMLRLKGAPFDTRSAELVAGAGPCSTCPKRTGNEPELFEDVQASDTCTDPTCYKAKVDAHWERLKAEVKTTGKAVVLEGDAAAAAGYSGKYVEADHRCYDKSGDKKWGVLLKDAVKSGAVKPVLIRDRYDPSRIRTLYPAKDAKAALGIKEAARVENDEEKKREAKKKLMLGVAAAAVPQILDRLNSVGSLDMARMMAMAAYEHTSIEAHAFTAKRRGLCKTTTEAREALQDFIRETNETDTLQDLTHELLLLNPGVSNWDPRLSDRFTKVAAAAGVDLKEIERTVKAAAPVKGKSKVAPAAPVSAEAEGGGKPSRSRRAPTPKAEVPEKRLPAIDEAIASHFEWNENGVCTNPDLLACPLPKKFKVEIRLAYTPTGKWVAGYEAGIAGSGVGCGAVSGPACKSGPVWETKSQAIGYVVGLAVRRLSDSMKTPAAVIEAVKAWAKKHGADAVKSSDVVIDKSQPPFSIGATPPPADAIKAEEVLHVMSVDSDYPSEIHLARRGGTFLWGISVTNGDGDATVESPLCNSHACPTREHALREASGFILAGLRKLGAPSKLVLAAINNIKKLRTA